MQPGGVRGRSSGRAHECNEMDRDPCDISGVAEADVSASALFPPLASITSLGFRNARCGAGGSGTPGFPVHLGLISPGQSPAQTDGESAALVPSHKSSGQRVISDLVELGGIEPSRALRRRSC